MAIYGVDLYAKSYYGIDVVVRFTVQPFRAAQYEHGQLQVTWTTPRQVSSPQSSGKAWSTLRLVRNFYGVPSTESDGEILLEVPYTAPVEAYLDTGVPPGRFAYYAIYVLTTHDAWDATHSYSVGDQVTYSSQNWIALTASLNQTPGSGSVWSTTTDTTEWAYAGACVGLSVEDWNYTQFLFDTQPRAYKVNVVETTASNPDFNNQLYQFDSVIGFAWDTIKSENVALSRINDIELTRDRFVWSIAEQMGIGAEVPDDPALRRLRVMDAATIARQKGSLSALETLVFDTTGWHASVSAGYNLMLDMDQAAAAHPVLPVWDAGARYQTNELIHYSGNVYKALSANQGQNPATATSIWQAQAVPLADPNNTLYNPTTGGLSSWRVTGTSMSVSLGVEIDGVAATTSWPTHNCYTMANLSGSANTVSMASVPAAIAAAWSSSTAYAQGTVATYAGHNYICILNTPASSITPDTDAAHWAPFLPGLTERLAQQYGIPLERYRPWDYERTYVKGDRVSATGNLYEAVYTTTGVSPSGYRTDTRGWRWVGSEQIAYTASVYYERQAPTASTTATCDIEFFDSQDNRIVAVGGAAYAPLMDRFEADGPIGSTEPSYPVRSQYGNPFPISWVDKGGPWQVSTGICETVYPATNHSGQLLVMSENAWGSAINPSTDPWEFAWVTFVHNSADPNREIGLVFRLDPSARTYWMMSPGNPAVIGSLGRLTKNTYAADFSSVAITQIATWAPLPNNTRVMLTANKSTNTYTGYAYNASGTNTTLFTATDSFSSAGLYFGLGERPMS